MENMILNATSVSKPFGDGQRVMKIALDYGTKIDDDSLKPESFSVENRTITDVFAADAPDADQSAKYGDYVILCLDKKDEAAPTVVDLHPHKPPERPEKEDHDEGGPPPHVMANGRVRRGPHGLAKKREPVRVKVTQMGEIKKADGAVIPAGSTVTTDREINELSDKFNQFWMGDVEYNLFIPKDYDPSKKYPMVLFIGDASIAGEDARITLEQGVGALCWVTDEMQEKQPCFVLAPTHNDEEPITDDDYWCTERLDVIKDLCDKVISEYSIDTKRVYTTGQSMGCMSSFELMYRYPDYFAGALCVSGHWDRSKIVTCAKRGQKIWFVISEEDGNGYPCALDLKRIFDEENIKYGWYEWNGRLSPEELSAKAEEAAADQNTFRITVYPGDSALRRGMDDEVDSGHPAGWCLSYRVTGLLDWLLNQTL